MKLLRLPLSLFVFLLLLFVSDHPAFSAAAPTAVGLNALSLSGYAPGQPFDFSGWVEVPYSAALNPSGGSLTIEAWVKRNDASRCETLVGNNFTTSYWLGFCPNLRFYPHGSGSAVDSNGSVPAGVWTHIAVTYDGTTRRYYLNGVLDTTSTANPGPITPASSGQSLGIGLDLTTNFTQNYFGGLIDELRIWNVVRTGQQIHDSLFISFGAPQPGLLAEWRFDGDANDPAGGHNGALRGGTGANFVNDGALPHNIRVPQVSVTPTLDGACNTQTEYANATKVTVGGASVYLLHSASDLWVCFSNLLDPIGTHDNWAAVYLDVDHSRDSFAQPDDFSLEVHSDGSLRARAGTGAGNYTSTTLADGKWTGMYRYCCGEFPTRSAEFRISSTLLNGWSQVIGCALAQHWITGVGDDRLWPALAGYDRPNTWSDCTLGGTSAPRTFSGQALYQPRDPNASPRALPGVGLNLIGSDPAGGEALVATMQTNLDGSFSLTSDDDYSRHRLELDPYHLPRGYVPQSSTAGASGTSVDARTVDYGAAGPGTYTSTVFTFGDAKPYVLDPLQGPYFIVVAPQAIINSGALADFVDFKQRLGFQVEVISTETINSSFGGADLRAKIRNMEIARRGAYGSRFKYLLLVGPHSVIPMAFINPYTISTADCTMNPGLPTDWPYADITSNFDSNGNGCLADGIWSDPAKRVGGYTPDSGIAFNASVAVGRLPFSSANAVRTALGNSMGFEKQAGSFKRKMIGAAAMMDLKGRCWMTPTVMASSYTEDGCDRVDHWGTDGSYLIEVMQNNFLNADAYSVTPFYETDHPATGSSPSHLISPQPLNEANVVAALNAQRYGTVDLHGHGNGAGVYRTPWSSDANSNGIPENPTSPPQNAYEVSGWPPNLTNWGMSSVTAQNDKAPIFIVASCSTGEFDDPNNFGAQLLSQGKGVAWVGGVATVQYYLGWTTVNNGPNGGMSDMDYFVTQRLLDRNLRVGDATWDALRQFIANGNTDFSGMVYDLYGDPTLSYWGNPGGQSTLAPWPMLREDAFGRGYATLAGPGVPTRLWSYSASAPGTGTIAPSPIVSNDGEVIVAYGSAVDVLRGGSLYQRLNLDAAAFGTPALAADGTIYALDVNGKLYAFPYGTFYFCSKFYCYATILEAPSRYRRWALALGSAPLTSPVVGSDGMIAVAHLGGNFFGIIYSNADLVRPDGVLFREEPILGNAVGALAVSADKKVYASTSTGTTIRIDYFCGAFPCKLDDGVISGPANTTPPLLAYGSLYIGRANGAVVKKNPATLANQATFVADSAITAGPVAGPGGQVLVGTQNGTLYSLSSGSLSLRWSRNIGASVVSSPAFSDDALYVVSGNYLRAYNPFSGAPLWSRFLSSSAGSGSVAVGYGRELYMQTSGGTVYGYGEGWALPPFYLMAKSVSLGSPREPIKAIEVQWVINPPPPPSPKPSPQPGSTAQPQSVIGYLLQRSSDGTDWEDVAVLPASTTIYTDTNILANTSYLYRVQTLDAAGNDSEPTSAPGSVQSMPPLPIPPTLDSVNVLAADRLQLAWHAQAGDEVSAFRIERSTDGTTFSPLALATGETTVYTDTALAAGTKYFYRIVAINGAGESVPSNVLSATTRTRTLPTPQNVVATYLPNGQVQISWNAGPAGVTTMIEVNPLGVSDYSPLGSANNVGPFAYTPPLPSSYGYRIKFVQGNAESDYAIASPRVSTGGWVGVTRFNLYLPIITR